MSFTHLEQLPFVGMSYEFVGEKQGAPFSAYVVTAKPREGSNAKTSVTPIRPRHTSGTFANANSQ
jgi:hypothetical protein